MGMDDSYLEVVLLLFLVAVDVVAVEGEELSEDPHLLI